MQLNPVNSSDELQVRVYQPINGEEAIKILVAAFQRKLENSGEFSRNRVFHKFTWQIGAKIGCYPSDVGELGLQTSGSEGIAPENLSPVEKIILASHLDSNTPPDMQREDANLDIPVIKKVDGQMIETREPSRKAKKS